MKTLFTFFTLCSLMLLAAGCGETPKPADNAAGESDASDTGTSPELGDATGEPPVSLGEQEEPAEEPFTEDGTEEAGSELPPFEEDAGGPELPKPNE